MKTHAGNSEGNSRNPLQSQLVVCIVAGVKSGATAGHVVRCFIQTDAGAAARAIVPGGASKSERPV